MQQMLPFIEITLPVYVCVSELTSISRTEAASADWLNEATTIANAIREICDTGLAAATVD